jgi:hypothetical protein
MSADISAHAWSRREKPGQLQEAGTSPFMRFRIQLYHAFLMTILLRHRQLHHVGMITFSDTLLIGRCIELRRAGA